MQSTVNAEAVGASVRDDLPPLPRRAPDRALAGLAVLIFSGLSLAASLASESFLEADGCTHYLYARFAFDEPHFLVNIWGRPFCTAAYAVPAALADRFGVRTMSLLLALATAWLTYRIAVSLRWPRPTLAFVFVLAQPLLFLHSFSELTELPFAFLLALAFLAYLKQRWFYFALVVTLLPTSRPEGFGFVALAAVALVAHRHWRWIPLLVLGIVVWSFAGWCSYGRPIYPGWSSRLPYWLSWVTWLPNNWPYAEKSVYQSGSVFHFVALMPAVVSPLMTPALWLGAWRIVVTDTASGRAGSRLRELLSPGGLVALIPLSVLVGHSILYATGRMASSGELRYMLVVAPFWALLVARGWGWLFERLRWRLDPLRAALFASLVPVMANVGYQVLPLGYTRDWNDAGQAAGWVQRTSLSGGYPKIMSAHPGVIYFLGISITDPVRVVEWERPNVLNPKRGVVMIWDSIYGTHNSDRNRIVTIEDALAAGWVPIRVPQVEDGWTDRASNWVILLSPYDINGRPTAQRTDIRR